MDYIRYIENILLGIWHLMQGMYITMLNFIRGKVTEQYPENRGKMFLHERMRGRLIMLHNEKNEHRCTACGICETNCPNGTIRVVGKKEIDEATGKGKKILDKYLYDVGSCIFCALCTASCPQNAIKWSNHFENAVFTRSKLREELNKKSSKLNEKNK